MDASILEIIKCWQEASYVDQEMLFLPVWQLRCFFFRTRSNFLSLVHSKVYIEDASPRIESETSNININ